MIGFSKKTLKVETADGHNCILLEGFTFTSKSGKTYEVPTGTSSDGASTPMIMWGAVPIHIPPFGWYWMATYLHDWAYRDSNLPKNECDDLLLEAMEWLADSERSNGLYGFSKEVDQHIKAKIIYEGVHFCGWSAFDGDRKDLKKTK